MTPSAEFQYEGMARTCDEEAYSQDRFLPAPAAELVATGFVGSQRVAEVRFHPFKYNPFSGELLHLRRIRARLDFSRESPQSQVSNPPVEERPFESLLQDTLLNYQTAKEWRAVFQPSTTYGIANFPNHSGYKMKVRDNGIYQVTYADLQASPTIPSTPATTFCSTVKRRAQVYRRQHLLAEVGRSLGVTHVHSRWES